MKFRYILFLLLILINPQFSFADDAKVKVKNYKGELHETEWYDALATCTGKIMAIQKYYQGITEEQKSSLSNLSVVFGSLAVDRLVTDRKISAQDANLEANSIVNAVLTNENNSVWIWRATDEPNKYYDDNLKNCEEQLNDYLKAFPDAAKK